jgi:hypothetical protein
MKLVIFALLSSSPETKDNIESIKYVEKKKGMRIRRPFPHKGAIF